MFHSPHVFGKVWLKPAWDTTMSAPFDTLHYKRRLTEAGFESAQAEVQVELMTDLLGDYANRLVTRDHLDMRFAESELRIEKRFMGIEKTLYVHSWMLGLIAAGVIVPQLAALAN